MTVSLSRSMKKTIAVAVLLRTVAFANAEGNKGGASSMSPGHETSAGKGASEASPGDKMQDTGTVGKARKQGRIRIFARRQDERYAKKEQVLGRSLVQETRKRCLRVFFFGFAPFLLQWIACANSQASPVCSTDLEPCDLRRCPHKSLA